MKQYVRTGQLIPLVGQEGILSPAGITKMYEFLNSQRQMEKYSLNTMDWRWMTKEGKLTKRIALLMYKDHGLQLSTEKLNELGNLCSKHCASSESMWIQIDNEFNWIRGDFSDSESCLFNDDRIHAFDAFKHMGVHSMKVFLEDDGTKKLKKRHWKKFYKHVPYGRCLLYPLPDIDNAIAVFNGYGGGRDTGYFANMLSGYLGWEHSKSVALSTATKHGVYFNGGNILISKEKQSITDVKLPSIPEGTKLKDLRTAICKSCSELLKGAEKHALADWSQYHVECVHFCHRCGYLEDAARFKQNKGKCTNCESEEGKCDRCENIRRGRIKALGLINTKTEKPKEYAICTKCSPSVFSCQACDETVYNTGAQYCPHCKESIG